MTETILSVSELQESDIPLITSYWLNADEAYLRGMGADITKMPDRQQWHQMLSAQLSQPYEQKQSYATIWKLNGLPIGHCNINKIQFGKQAHMHLHIWDSAARKMGYGSALIRLSLPYFFKHMQLEKLYCEPYALNPAPNSTLKKAGFTFLHAYVGTPGWINFEQEINVWEMTRKKYLLLLSDAKAR